MSEESVQLIRRDGVPWLTVVGPLDYRTTEEIGDTVIESCSTEGEIVADLTRLGFIDSTGLSLLLKLRHAAGTVRLVGTPDHAETLLRLTGVDHLFVYDVTSPAA